MNDARSGQVDVLDPGALVRRNTFVVQADGDLPPLSDYLLAALDFPRETIPSSRDGKATTRDLKFTDLFAYVYREACNIDREVVGHLDTWFNTKRTALFKLMFALTDSTVLELSRKLGELKEELRKKTDEYEAVKNFLGATDPRTEDQLRAELASLRDMLQRADATLASLRHELEESTAADAVLRQDLRAAVDSAREATQEVQAAQELVEARAAVVAQVELDLSRLDRSTTAIEKLSPFNFVVCPRCMQRLSTRPVPEDHCVVCLQHDPHDQDVDPAAVAQTRRTLELQLQDAQAVLDADSGVLEAAQQRAQQADFFAHSLRRQLDAQTRDLVAPRFDAIADASARAASLRAAIDAVTQLRDSWRPIHGVSPAFLVEGEGGDGLGDEEEASEGAAVAGGED
ncbi:hypothetical protein ABZV60_29230, partial [Streptomyces sp. NPDC004787]